MFQKQLIYRSSDIMKFTIHLGIPEILALWTRLKKSDAEGTISKSDAQLYRKWGKNMKLLS